MPSVSSWLSLAVRVDEGTRLGETGKGQHGSPREHVELSSCPEDRLGSGFKPILQNSVQSPQALFPEQTISWRNTQTLPALRLTVREPRGDGEPPEPRLRAWSVEPLPGDTPQLYTDPLWASAFPSLEWGQGCYED